VSVWITGGSIIDLQGDTGLEVQQVRTHRMDVIMCRGFTNNINPTSCLQEKIATHALPADQNKCSTQPRMDSETKNFHQHVDGMEARQMGTHEMDMNTINMGGSRWRLL